MQGFITVLIQNLPWLAEFTIACLSTRINFGSCSPEVFISMYDLLSNQKIKSPTDFSNLL
jgi:hypothetical protein